MVYSLPAAPLAALFILYAVYTPKYYVDGLSLSASFVAFVLLISRIWDAALDPLVGYLSDRVRLRGTRRKSILCISAFPFGLLFLTSLSPFVVESSAAFVAVTMALFVAYTFCAVPYEAWGVDLCEAPHDRSRVSAWREGAGLFGMLFALSLPALLTTMGWTLSDALWATALTCVAAFILAVCAVYYLLPERQGSTTSRSPVALLTPLRMMEFRRLSVAFVLSGIGAAIPATVVLFYVEAYLNSTRGPLFLLTYFIAGILALPFWVVLSKRMTKRAAWVAALIVNTLAFACIYLVQPGDELLYGVLVAVSGLGFGATLALPTSIQIDVIEEAARRTGQRSEGQFFGLWSFSRKVSAAIGAYLSLKVLGLYGYSGAEQASPVAVAAIRDLYILAPCVFMLAAAVMALRIPVMEVRE